MFKTNSNFEHAAGCRHKTINRSFYATTRDALVAERGITKKTIFVTTEMMLKAISNVRSQQKLDEIMNLGATLQRQSKRIWTRLDEAGIEKGCRCVKLCWRAIKKAFLKKKRLKAKLTTRVKDHVYGVCDRKICSVSWIFGKSANRLTEL